MSANEHLSPQQFRYTHSTDAELRPGDVLKPAAETGVESRFKNVRGYDPGRVYFSDTRDEHFDPLVHEHYGKYTYAVEPLGHVSADPEVEHRTQRYAKDPRWHEDFGAAPGGPWNDEYLGSALSGRSAPAARVLRRLYE